MYIKISKCMNKTSFYSTIIHLYLKLTATNSNLSVVNPDLYIGTIQCVPDRKGTPVLSVQISSLPRKIVFKLYASLLKSIFYFFTFDTKQHR